MATKITIKPGDTVGGINTSGVISKVATVVTSVNPVTNKNIATVTAAKVINVNEDSLILSEVNSGNGTSKYIVGG